ncbi:DUF2125 domain-containing protein [Roseomonas sp. PWR1]|uniref:DUF2125 domain-containing protein n=1 Tax=Roseomonas nitratireducens TaxID=2820810 RepID=A0ABS4AYA4_9PROT|nr:DUF2125 domain-containing protein [Neoroseomonas nitratireducens]MBP0465731.1 DUF2125 domain-containing protein [Neoroseomonas nitratireducens]
MTAKTPARPARGYRRAAIGALLLFAALLAAHGLAWRFVTGAMAVGFSDWVAQRRAEGWTVDHGVPTRGGWPFAARLTVPDVAVAGVTPSLPQGFAWTAGQLALAIVPPRLDRLVVVPQGPQALRLGAAEIPYAADRLELVLPLEPGPGPRAAALTVAGLRAAAPDGPLSVDSLRASLVPAPEGDAAILAAQAERVVLPASPLAAAFGQRIEHAALEARLTGPVVAAPGLPPALRAEAWRRAGGSLDVTRIALRWGPLLGEGVGVLRLDPALQPEGTGTLALEGAPEALAALARAGLVAPRAALAGQAALALMGRAPPSGGPPRIDVPISLQGGVVAVARIPLARIAPVAWPGPR